MNVFVLCTGRCGSTTFARAASHITNFTAGHETRSHLLGAAHFAYPPDHVEVDNRLTWFLGPIHRAFPDAYYVHLLRDELATARSFLERFGHGIIGAYTNGIMMGLHDKAPKLDVCLDYVRTVNENVRHFLRDRPHMTIDLARAKDGFAALWREIGAEGDLDTALREFDTRYNRAAA